MFRLLFPYLLFGVLALVVVYDNVGGHSHVSASEPKQSTPTDPTRPSIGRDPVCQMDVGDKITATLEDTCYYFCTKRCRELFLENPEVYATECCPVCLADTGIRKPVGEGNPAYTWQNNSYHFCTEKHRDAFAQDPAGYFIHTMWGIPTWLYRISIGLVLILSFGLFEIIARWSRNRRETAPPRLNLLRIPFLVTLLRWPPFRFILQLVFVFFFAVIVLAGLFGDQLAARNIAPLLTWTVWWGGLVVVIMFVGKAWCYVCPWDAISRWIEKMQLWGKAKGGLGLGLRWPRRLRTIALAIAFFVGLTWLELGFGVTMNPRATALLGLLMLTLTLVSVLIFERQAFCRYACLVGRVSGLYALFSATEVRAVDRKQCQSCKTQDCYHGNEKGEGCPTGLFPGTLDQNTYCIDCLECVKTCPTGNMTINARPWAADLSKPGHPRKDEAYLALLMLAITGFHGLTMTPAWKVVLDFLGENLGLSYIPAFSLGMLLLMLTPLLIYGLLLKFTVIFSRTPSVSYGKAFISFAYAVLPIALFYHLAHNSEHLMMEGQKVIPLLSNPFGFAPGDHWNFLGISGVGPWDLFGTAEWVVAPLITLPTLWLLQVTLVLVGHVYSLWVADRTARRLYPGKGNAVRSQVPMLLGMVLFSMFSLWLLKQPMEMRTSAM